MSKKLARNYMSIHLHIKKKLTELSKNDKLACVDIAHLASSLRMDIRTVKSHLRIMEVDEVGVFMDSDEKEFCTKKGVTRLANRLNTNNKNN